MAKTVGKPLNVLVDQPRDEITSNIFGDYVRRTFRTAYSGHRALLAPIHTAHPIYTLSTLRTINVSQIPGADLCDVVYNYEPDGVSETAPVPEDEVSEAGSTVEIDIQQHPDFDDDEIFPAADKVFETVGGAQVFKGFKAGTPLAGQTKYVVGTGQVAITVFSRTKPASVQADLGKLKAPGHGLPGAAPNYLVLTGGVTKRGGFWARTLVYQYSAKPYPTNVYATA